MILAYLDWVFLRNSNMDKNNKNQGITHLISIFLLPVLIIIGYYVPWIMAKIVVGVLLIGTGYFIWKKILK